MEIKEKATSIRFRALSVTIVVLIALIFYLLVQIFFKDSINVIDLTIVATIQIVLHFTYFPEGELFGQNDKVYIANKTSYNAKANAVNDKKAVGDLRKFCEIEYKQRVKEYFSVQLGKLGIEQDEFDELKKLSQKQIKKLKQIEINGKMINFSKHTRKILYGLVFGKVPVEKNSADNILSATETNSVFAIKDETRGYKAKSSIFVILKAIVFGTFLAYIGYTAKDGVTVETFAKMSIYVSTMFTTAVFSYAKGEKASKVYKSNFYLRLSVFLDEFFEFYEKGLTKGE